MWIMLLWACSVPVAATAPAASGPAAATPSPPDPFVALLAAPMGPKGPVVSDGFDNPVSGTKLRAASSGWVPEGETDPLTVHSVFYENQQRREAVLRYEGVHGPAGMVERGQELGNSAGLKLQLTVDGEPSDWDPFLSNHRALFVPQREPVLVVVSQKDYVLRIYKEGVEQGSYDVSFGQSKGPKVQRGDNRTPVGMYFLTYKTEGPFDGDYGAYYGGHWMKLNYPNAYDAERGVAMGLITPQQQTQIVRAWRSRAETLQKTPLGGGIGFHGWAAEWSNAGPRHLSWGCIVLHLSDVDAIYRQLPVGTMVIVY